ncbi:MAG: ANL family adenylate-forming protein [Acidimicrobiales bacterium]
MERLLEVLAGYRDRDAIIWADRAHSYQWLTTRMADWADRCRRDGIEAGAVVGVRGDFSPDTVALFVALAQRACVIVPLAARGRPADDELLELAEVEHSYTPLDGPERESRRYTTPASNGLYARLRATGHSGLVLFSSGTAGVRKAALHDLERLLEPFLTKRRPYRALAFLVFDHIGGINTMLRVLSSGGCLVVPADRSPDRVLQAISDHRVELLPTSPSFLNLMLVSGAHARYDLSSLRLVTYGTEPMPPATLARLRAVLVDVDVRQTYGLSEVGILNTRSRGPDSVWVQVGGPGFETRIVDGVLEIRARSAMLGYLNAASPFTSDGWFSTGDLVETEGQYVRILGRATEMVNVGGRKVHPSIVENVLHEIDGVAEATVYGEKNALLGSIVCARIRPSGAGDHTDLVRRIKAHCRERLAPHEVPVRLVVGHEPHHGDRYKKIRSQESTGR